MITSFRVQMLTVFADDVLITETGIDNLTTTPKGADEIEALMSSAWLSAE